jgi:hypothetical protein
MGAQGVSYGLGLARKTGDLTTSPNQPKKQYRRFARSERGENQKIKQPIENNQVRNQVGSWRKSS